MDFGPRLKIVVSPVRVRVSPSQAPNPLQRRILWSTVRCCRTLGAHVGRSCAARDRISAPGLGCWHSNSRHRAAGVLMRVVLTGAARRGAGDASTPPTHGTRSAEALALLGSVAATATAERGPSDTLASFAESRGELSTGTSDCVSSGAGVCCSAGTRPRPPAKGAARGRPGRAIWRCSSRMEGERGRRRRRSRTCRASDTSKPYGHSRGR
jgi:hypothetical protein